MAKRRVRGDGALFRDGTGRWVARVTIDGRRVKATRRTEAEARAELRKMLRRVEDGMPVEPGDLTVAGLLEQWETKHLPNRNLEPATVCAHRAAVRFFTRTMGKRRVRSLTPEQVEDALDRFAATDRSRATISKYRGTLAMALDWGERRGYVARNVARVAEIPAIARTARAGRSMTVEQVKKLLVAAKGTRLAAMWTTMLYLGIRPGEAAALSWSDIDFDLGIVHVCRGRKLDLNGAAMIGDTKTSWSVRSLDAPPPVLRALKAHVRRQAADRLAAAKLWQNEHDLVFTSPTGRPTDPSAVRREFRAVVEQADIGDGWTPNMLRHTSASLMADAGVPIEEVADQLGHRDTRMASLHYRHRIRPTVSGGTTLDAVLGRR
jgi:integrase